MSSPSISLLTGDLESGKSSLCLQIVRLLQEKGLNPTGLISPAVFEGDQKTAIEVMNVSSGERRRLAELKTEPGGGLETKRWAFDPQAVAWGNQVLSDALPSDLLIIDELGPLEFNRAEGWTVGMELIDNLRSGSALLVIRPSLIQAASRRWQISRVLDLSGSGPFPRSVEDFITTLGIQA